MNAKKRKISRKDPEKTPKVWERARREKMKIYFNELEEVLPFYDPSTPMSRFEILQKSKICIKDLQDQNQDLLNGGFDEVYRNKMTKLKRRVKELLRRVDQLTDLLRAANIMIPPLETYTDDFKTCTSFKWMNQRPKKWSEKINLVVPDEKIKSVLTLIKDYKRNSGKINAKKKPTGKANIENSNQNSVNGNSVTELPLNEQNEKNETQLRDKTNSNESNTQKTVCDNSDSLTESQSPTQFKENHPVDYNLMEVVDTPSNGCNSNNGNVNSNSSNQTNENSSVKTGNNGSTTKSNNNNSTNYSNVNGNGGNGNAVISNSVSNSGSVAKSNSVQSTKSSAPVKLSNAQVIIPQAANTPVGLQQKLVDTQGNIVLPTTPSVLQSNTFILTNDGSLVQLPILNSSGNVFDGNSNLLAPATIVKPNAGLLTPIVINKPSPVIVLQKQAAPQIIQTAQILNAAPQVISVSKSSVQIVNSSLLYTTSNPVGNTRPLTHILSKAPANKKKIMRDSTTTTYVNKIPIPALSKQSYTKKNVTGSAGTEKSKTVDSKQKDSMDKAPKPDSKSSNECENGQGGKKSSMAKPEVPTTTASEKEKENDKENDSNLDGLRKRNLDEDKREGSKKQKLKENLEENVFKPIDNPIETDAMFCNLGLPNAINTSLSVSPTAAFLSSFPIVTPVRSETDDDLAEKKTDDGKGMKQTADETSALVAESNAETTAIVNNGGSKTVMTKDYMTQTTTNHIQNTAIIADGKGSEVADSQMKLLTEVQVNGNFSGTTGTEEDLNNTTGGNAIITASTTATNNTNKNNIPPHQQHQPQLDSCKTWAQYQDTCDIRSDTYYLPSDTGIQMGHTMTSIEPAPAGDMHFPGMSSGMNNPTYKTYPSGNGLKVNGPPSQNSISDHVTLKGTNFEYGQKENTYMTQVPDYTTDRSVHKKQCSNAGTESFLEGKSQSLNYNMDSGPAYQLIPAKEVPNQRNARTVNWMTEPDVRNRGMVYGSQGDKMATVPKAPTYPQTDNFFPGTNQGSMKAPGDCTKHFMPSTDPTKMTYQKNDFFGKDQRCKAVDKQTDPKFYPKVPQNTYNIFDYNYTGSCYAEDDSNKYCQAQSYLAKNKKSMSATRKKGSDGVIQLSNETQAVDPAKRPSEQIITNLDFNPVSNQECFTWMPGKNVDWLPGKSFGLDTNLVVPSTLPTLVGDLALGTPSTNDVNLAKGVNAKSSCQANLKTLPADIADLGLMANPVGVAKPMDSVDPGKQYLEPFANLSKNIFDITPSNVNASQTPKNDFDKVNFLGGNSNSETIILKNIFELPVSKSVTTSTTGDFNRHNNSTTTATNSTNSSHKQRNMSNPQNTFLSVSQLVEPPPFDGAQMKNESQLELAGAGKTDVYGQSYPNSFTSQGKAYKSKGRSSHCKYSDRKYQGYKGGTGQGAGQGPGTVNGHSTTTSSSYTAEALIRSNSVNCQSAEFAVDMNGTFFGTGKPNQKSDHQFVGNDINGKTDFQSSTGQNLYTDFNFSSPVPNFTIGPTVGTTDFTNHDPNSNFSSQNNSFFTDFITPEYPLSDNVPNSLLIPPCSIALQSPFAVDKKSFPGQDKAKHTSKQYSNSGRTKKHYECSKSTSFNEFSVPAATAAAIFTTSSLTCPTIFTTSACQNLLPVPTQSSIPISFSSPSFTTGNISFPPFSTTTGNNYHKFPGNTGQNASSSSSSSSSSSGSFLSTNAMFTTSPTSKLQTSNCYPSNPLTTVTNSVISSSFSVGNVPFSASASQSAIPFFSLSQPIIPSSAPTSSSNSLANFNLSTIFPEINQKGNYHYS